MKKFKFRLERILQIKKHLEGEKQKSHGLAGQRVVDQERYLSDLDLNRRTVKEEQRDHLMGKLEPNFLVNYSRFYLKLRKQELTGREILKVYITEREKRRQELVKATKQKKIYEKLKERRIEQYNRELELHIQKEQDEMATKMFVHKKSPHL
jgi:flagellar FliJ protein